MLNYIWVALGGALGSMARFWLSGLVAGKFGESFPFGTLIVNITGCFILGVFATLAGTEGRLLVSPGFRIFFIFGICGGYTTFSSFSLQTLNLARDGEWLWAGLNVLGSVALCMLGVWLGHLLAVAINNK
jgi:CrcB protein